MIDSIAYLSVSNIKPTAREVDEMLDQFKSANKLHALTGFLVYDQNHFFQYIEGPEKEIAMLMKNIRKDPRHKIMVESNNRRSDRRFKKWSMKIIGYSNLTRILPENKLIDLIAFSITKKDIIPEWESYAWEIINEIAEKQMRII
ncbi:MAG: BLUF domain-containing protein [Cyclobacteriaceae bacterium]